MAHANSKKGLLVAGAALAVAGVVALSSVNESSEVTLRCQTRTRANHRNILEDGGTAGKLTGRYATVLIAATKLEDGGIVRADLGSTLEYYGDTACVEVEVDRPGRLVAIDHPCACRKAQGPCAGADGGSAPFGVTLYEDEWSGAGCLPKPCVEIAGESSWPEDCPASEP